MNKASTYILAGLTKTDLRTNNNDRCYKAIKNLNKQPNREVIVRGLSKQLRREGNGEQRIHHL